jgi:DivIVA domain-containing protein
MGELILLLIAALVVGAIVFGVAVLISGDDQGIEGHEPDGRAIPLPTTRPLGETDVTQVRFDTVIRGYRMAQVDAAFRRAAYDIGYKEELIQVLEAEVTALRDGRIEDADALQQAREAAMSGATSAENPIPLTIELDDNTPSTVAQ